MRLKAALIVGVIIIITLLINFAMPKSSEPTDATTATKPAKDIRIPQKGLAIEIKKKERQLLLYSDGKVEKTYRIGLGRKPTGTKEKEGDMRTPEGAHYICSKNPKSSFHLSLGLSYPNITDARRGFEKGLITQKQYSKIEKAIKRKKKPLWNTELGGEIFIHGDGSKTDWTLGCIALDNDDIDELFDRVKVKTHVIIKP